MDNLIEEFIANGDLAQLKVKIISELERFRDDESFQALCLLVLELKVGGVTEKDIINAIAVATVLQADMEGSDMGELKSEEEAEQLKFEDVKEENEPEIG